MGLQDLQVEIECRVRRGEPLSRIEENLIEHCGVAEDAKAALWLYGWCLLEEEERRCESAGLVAHGPAAQDD
jgi:hypothetical protein